MPVRPVRTRSPSGAKNANASLRRDNGRGARARRALRAPSVVESTIAPAASVGPSMPSVPMLASCARRGRRRAARRARARTPGCGRRRRCPCTRTVVSPLETTHAGPRRRRASRRAPRASHAGAASRASPTTGFVDHDDVIAARSAAPPRAGHRVAPAADDQRRGARDRRGSPASASPARRPRRRRRITSRDRARIRVASPPKRVERRRARRANVRRIRHGRPGPDDVQVVADDVRDRERDRRAPAHAAASRPPLIADRCLRTVFSAWMSAPAAAAAASCSSCPRASGRRPATAISADAPPDSRTTSASSECTPCATASARPPAARCRASGYGWLPTIHSTSAGSASVRRACRSRRRAECARCGHARRTPSAIAARPSRGDDVQRPSGQRRRRPPASPSARAITRRALTASTPARTIAIEILSKRGDGSVSGPCGIGPGERPVTTSNCFRS